MQVTNKVPSQLAFTLRVGGFAVRKRSFFCLFLEIENDGIRKKKQKEGNASQTTLTFRHRRRIARTLGAVFPLAIVRTVHLWTSTRRAAGGRCRRARAGAPGTGCMESLRRSAADSADAADDGEGQQGSLAVPQTLPTSTRAPSSRQRSRWKRRKRKQETRRTEEFSLISPSSLSFFALFALVGFF